MPDTRHSYTNVASLLIRTLYSSSSPRVESPPARRGLSIESVRKPVGYPRARGTELVEVSNTTSRRPQPIEPDHPSATERVPIELRRKDRTEHGQACGNECSGRDGQQPAGWRAALKYVLRSSCQSVPPLK